MAVVYVFLILVAVVLGGAFLAYVVAWLGKYFIKRQIRKIYRNVNNSFFAGGDTSQGKEPAKPKTAPKKIEKDVGEYVRFEELDVESKTTTYTFSDGEQETRTEIKIEEQIVDVEWEDIE